jgi:hypothetical protein
MTRTSGNPRPESRVWNADMLRLTAFHRPGALGATTGWWQQLTGQEPESSVLKPKSGDRGEVGIYEGVSLGLQIQPLVGRVDWILGEPDDSFENPDNVSFLHRLNLFMNLVSRWLRDSCPPTTRVALGAILTFGVADRATGYRTIANFLPFDPDPDTSQDFLYQINRPRRSRVIPDQEINRLMRWSVGLHLHQTIDVSRQGMAPSTPNISRSFCRLELDINTMQRAENQPPLERLPDLLGEFVGLAQEIIREGDIP